MIATVTSGSRLHLGFTSLSSGPKPWSGIGLMTEEPKVTVRVVSRGAGRLLCSRDHEEVVRSVAEALTVELGSFDVEVSAPPLHVGLGTTTQLTLALGAALSTVTGIRFDPLSHARLTGRGKRSWVGIAGFIGGGLVVDLGRREDDAWAHDFVNVEFPRDWAVLLVWPVGERGLSGGVEEEAIAAAEDPWGQRAAVDVETVIDAVRGHDFDGFVGIVERLQEAMSSAFSRSQGGKYHRASEGLVELLKEHGARGIGQSSWGPTVYGFFKDRRSAESAALRLVRELEGGEFRVLVTEARNRGAEVSVR
ncbi:MAG: hypothetical protein NZ733_03085 [Aigarchaeota archaeon]|nr:hypothetical protein [Aigarchaeota archaeon]MCS7126898.1 hypothetical protein [Candidatus Calditenuaceae archaeon]MDW8043963.1 hypothetical protein [Nitrososphaerota archaeon]